MRPPEPQRAEVPSDIAAALEGYAAQVVPAARVASAGRSYSLRDTVLVLAVACAVTVALDAEGLLSWARRLDVGPVQTVLLRALTPLHTALGIIGASTPRRWTVEVKNAATRSLGVGGDPLLAEGWVAPTESPAPDLPTAPESVVAFPPEPQLPAVEPEPVVAAVAEVATPTGGVLLLGDSMMAGSLGATLEQTLSRRAGLHVTRAAQLGTGLARPDVYDWMKVVPALLQREQPRYVVVALGANDATNLNDGDEQVDYGTARWRQVYAARVEAMMRALSGTETRVLWLTLPPMRERRLSSRAVSLNAVFAHCARRVPRVELLELDVLVANRDREYATFVQAPDGKWSRYRLDDGVHLAPAGARVVASWISDWLRERR